MTPEQKDAAQALAELDIDVWVDNAVHFNCTEASAIASFLHAFGGGIASSQFLREHRETDDECRGHEIDGRILI